MGVEIDVDRTVLFRQDIDRRFDTPVGIETVPVVSTDPDGCVARIGIENTLPLLWISYGFSLFKRNKGKAPVVFPVCG